MLFHEALEVPICFDTFA